MALLNQPTQQAPQPQEGAPTQEGQQPSQQSQQQVYTKLVTMMLEYLYSEQGVDMVMQGAQMPGKPFQNVGIMVARLLQRLFITAKTQNKQIPPKIMYQAGMELTQAIIDMVLESGRIQQQEAQKVAEDGFLFAVTTLGKETSTDIFTAAEREEFRKMIQAAKAMKERGQQPAQPQEAMA